MNLRTAPTLLVCVALAACAAAQIAPHEDAIGIYADLDGLTNCIHAHPGDVFEVYLLLTRPTAVQGVNAWELTIDVPHNVEIWGWNIPGTYMNMATPPTFQVAHNPPLAVTPVVHLMTFIVVCQDASAGRFYIREPIGDTDHNGWPEYLDSADVGTEKRLYPYPAGPEEPVFVVNGGVAAETMAWGDVKALYRD